FKGSLAQRDNKTKIYDPQSGKLKIAGFLRDFIVNLAYTLQSFCQLAFSSLLHTPLSSSALQRAHPANYISRTSQPMGFWP
ncbi:hypothetical protein, partial [Herbidospora sp. RD11066]